MDNYTGPGSSLLYSILQAKQALQCPFIFNACDTIFDENYGSAFGEVKSHYGADSLMLKDINNHLVNSEKVSSILPFLFIKIL